MGMDVIELRLADLDSFEELLLDAARLMAGVRHPNVVEAHDLGQEGDCYRIGMEVVEGHSLDAIMRRHAERGTLVPPAVACCIVADAARGLHAIHELSTPDERKLHPVHGDVCPHSIVVMDDGTTKVGFKGMRTLRAQDPGGRSALIGQKLPYISPELVGDESIDRRADIFGLGVILWELITGRPLFLVRSGLDTISNVLACDVPSPTAVMPSCPKELVPIIMKALTKKPDGRHGTALDLAHELAACSRSVTPADIAGHVRALLASASE